MKLKSYIVLSVWKIKHSEIVFYVTLHGPFLIWAKKEE